jgi:hypothetical protein
MEVKMKTKHSPQFIHLAMIAFLLFASMILGACSPMTSVEAAQQTEESPSNQPEDEQLPTAIPTVDQVDETQSNEAPAPAMDQYMDVDYRLAFDYPAGWSLNVTPTGQGAGNGYPVSHVVELTNDKYRVLIQIKLNWDHTVIGGAMPPGEVQKDEKVSLLGQSIDRNLLVYQNLSKLVWYAGRFDDLELYIRIESKDQSNYERISIDDSMIKDVESIISSFVRTGDAYSPPAEPAPTQPAEPVACSLPSRLNVNDWAVVSPGLPNVIRSEPGRGPNSSIVGEISAGTTIRLLEGPVCASGYYWWRVDVGMVSGWTAEGGDGAYWLERIAMDEPTLVEGWVGTIVSTPEWPQIDDYFQMLNQGGSRYGITSTDAAIRQQLEELRDTGKLIRVWGKLYYGRVDAYNTQIDVEDFELFIP